MGAQTTTVSTQHNFRNTQPQIKLSDLCLLFLQLLLKQLDILGGSVQHQRNSQTLLWGRVALLFLMTQLFTHCMR